MSSTDDHIRFPFISFVWGLSESESKWLYWFWKNLRHYALTYCLTSLGSHSFGFGLRRFIITFSPLTHWEKKGRSNLPKMLGCFQLFIWTLMSDISNTNGPEVKSNVCFITCLVSSPLNNESSLKARSWGTMGLMGLSSWILWKPRADPHLLAEVNTQVQQGCLQIVFR